MQPLIHHFPNYQPTPKEPIMNLTLLLETTKLLSPTIAMHHAKITRTSHQTNLFYFGLLATEHIVPPPRLAQLQSIHAELTTSTPSSGNCYWPLTFATITNKPDVLRDNLASNYLLAI